MSDRVRKLDYYYTTVGHRAGQGGKVLGELRDAGVNLLAVHAFPQGNRAQIDFFPENARKLERAAKGAGIRLSPRRTAFFIEGRDRIGAVAETLEKLGREGINVTALDAMAVGGRYGSLLWVRRDKVNRAARVLGAKR